MTKRQKRAWWKQKSERIAQQRFGGFQTSLASRRSSFVLEPDYADITKRLRLCVTTSLFFNYISSGALTPNKRNDSFKTVATL